MSHDGSYVDVRLGSTGAFDPKTHPVKVPSPETNFQESRPGFLEVPIIENCNSRFWEFSFKSERELLEIDLP